MEDQASWGDEQRDGQPDAPAATEVGSDAVTKAVESSEVDSAPNAAFAAQPQLEDLRGTALVEALIARDSKRLLEQSPDAKYALQGIRRYYERQAAVADGVYVFLKNRGLAKR